MTDFKDRFAKMANKADGFTSLATGVGVRGYDARLDAEFLPDHEKSDEMLSALYRSSDLANNIVNMLVEDAMRQGWTLDGYADDVVKKLDDFLGITQAVADARVFARLYGGAVILLGARGHDYTKPRPTTAHVDFLRVIPMKDLTVPAWYTDLNHEKFFTPAHYDLRIPTIGQARPEDPQQEFQVRVHESWCIKTQGIPVEMDRRVWRKGFGDSFLGLLWASLRDFELGWNAVTRLLQDSAVGVYKIKDLFDILSSNNADLLQKRLQIMDSQKSNFRSIVLDADGEEYARSFTSLLGLPDMCDRLMARFAAAARLPQTKVFGRSPAGMNATGDADIRIYYDAVKAEQDMKVKPIISQILAAAHGGAAENSFEVLFPSLWQTTPMENATLLDLEARAYAQLIDRNVFSPDEVARILSRLVK